MVIPRAAFLRSINVGGRRVKSAELVALFEELGLADVAAYQAAGNLVFSGDMGAAPLRRRLSERLGYDVPVILRSFEELAGIAAAVPFSEAERAASRGKVQVLLLEREPPVEVIEQLLALDTPDDRLCLRGRELYWLPVSGVSESALDFRQIERLLGSQTCRTQGTLRRMARKFGATSRG